MTEPDEHDDESKGKGSEAARWRVRLRAAEGERDVLAGRLAALQDAEVMRLASDRLADPSDLAAFGTHTADLLDDDGNLDPSKVDEAVEGLLAKRPRLGKDWEPDAEGLDGGARTSVRSGGATWGSLLNGAQR